MTAAAALIAEVRHYGGRLTPDGDILHVAAPEPLPGELMAALAAHKAELMRLLRPSSCHGWIVAFNDRLLVMTAPSEETADMILRTYPDAQSVMRLPDKTACRS